MSNKYIDRNFKLNLRADNIENSFNTECLTTVSIKEATSDTLQRCPHCGESYYMENFCDTTCVYYPSIYKDGVNINPDRNTTTVHCTCMSCGKEFNFTR